MTDCDALAAELAEYARPEQKNTSSLQERIESGFTEIQNFVKVHGRLPEEREDSDIFERMYAIRLKRLRSQPEYHGILSALDSNNLLGQAVKLNDEITDETLETLLTELSEFDTAQDIFELHHVRPSASKQMPEEIAHMKQCKDFAKFASLFQRVKAELAKGMRQSRRFIKDASVNVGDFFILAGQIVYVAEVGEIIRAPNGGNDARLRLIYSSGMESNLLRRSLQRALYKDEAGRRISASDTDMGPLFHDSMQEGEPQSGQIYVLRSLSENSYIAKHRDLIHKIGVTQGSVDKRIVNAAAHSTYLFANVTIVACYKLADIQPRKLEHLLHRVFAAARLDLVVLDRFGQSVQPREWFLVPLAAIEKAIDLIKDNSIVDALYDPKKADFVKNT